jgi:hypothetical protein
MRTKEEEEVVAQALGPPQFRARALGRQSE